MEEHEEHCAAIIASLLRNCAEKGRQRVLAKFVEQDHIKVPPPPRRPNSPH